MTAIPPLETSNAPKEILRPRLIALFEKAWREADCISVEAKAGQGKTTAVAQWLKHKKHKHAWIHLSRRDRDPASLIHTMGQHLAAAFPQIQDLIEAKQIGFGETHQDGKRLAQAMGSQAKGPQLLIFDDLHFLDGAEEALALVAEILKAPFTTLVTTRVPLARLMASPPTSVRIGDGALSLTPEENRDLCQLFQLNDSFSSAQILEKSEGWIMGALAEIHHRTAQSPHSQPMDGEVDISLFAALPQETMESLSRLALPEELPRKLAKELSGDKGIEILEGLTRANHFVTTTSTHYLFHHLFQERLQAEARRRLSRTAVQDTLTHAARFFLSQNMPEEAIHHAASAEDHHLTEEILKRHGMEMMVMDHRVSLHETLSLLPMAGRENRGWINLFSAISAMNLVPEKVPSHLEKAEAAFCHSQEAMGRFLTHAQWLFWHLTVEGNFIHGKTHLEAAEALLPGVRPLLPQGVLARELNILGLAALFIDGNPKRCRAIIDEAIALTRNLNGGNLLAEIEICRCYKACLSGHQGHFLTALESLFKTVHKPGVTAYSLLMGRMAQLNYLSMQGDTDRFTILKQALIEQTETALQVQGRLTPFLVAWEADLAIASGHWDEARRHIDTGLALPFAGTNPQMRSQYLHFKAYVAALTGNKEEAWDTLEESIRLRDLSGSPYYTLRNRIVAGAVCRILKKSDESMAHLTQALEIASSMGDQLGRLSALCQRAALFLDLNMREKAGEDLGEVAELQKSHRIQHIFTAEPALLAKLSEAARDLLPESSFFETLHQKWTDTGTWKGKRVPLVHIQTMGAFSISCEGKRRITSQDLPSSQQELMGLLLTSPQHRIHADEVQAALWPESSKEKARASFDALVTRLRKSWRNAVAPHPVAAYFRIEKQTLSLTHVRVDLTQCLFSIHEGLRFATRDMGWSALGRFRQAHKAWNPAIFPGFRLNALTHTHLQTRVYPAYRESVRVWSQRLLELSPPFPEDINALERAVDRETVELESAQALHAHLMVSGDPLRARRLLERLHRLLEEEEVPFQEIQSMLSGFSQPRSSEK